MTLVIKINMDNAAFEDPSIEVGRILKEMAEKDYDFSAKQLHPLRDINGNKVGFFTVQED